MDLKSRFIPNGDTAWLFTPRKSLLEVKIAQKVQFVSFLAADLYSNVLFFSDTLWELALNASLKLDVSFSLILF